VFWLILSLLGLIVMMLIRMRILLLPGVH